MFGSTARYFLTLAETKSFSRTAELLFVSQPSVSKQITMMEEELEIPLFERTTRTVRLTPQGKLLYKALKKSEALWLDAVKDAKEIDTELKGTLRVGMLYGWDVSHLPTAVFTNFQKKYPFVDVLIQKYTYCELTRLLLQGELDIILTLKEELDDHSEFRYQEAFDDPLMLLISAAHPIAAQTDVFTYLDKMNVYVMGPKASRFSVVNIEKLLAEEGAVHARVIPSPNFESIMLAVDRLQGCTITALSSVACTNPIYRCYPIPSVAHVVCAYNTNFPQKMTEKFCAELKTESLLAQKKGSKQPGEIDSGEF